MQYCNLPLKHNILHSLCKQNRSNNIIVGRNNQKSAKVPSWLRCKILLTRFDLNRCVFKYANHSRVLGSPSIRLIASSKFEHLLGSDRQEEGGMYLDNGFDCSLNAIRAGHGMDVVGIGLPQVQDICILP